MKTKQITKPKPFTTYGYHSRCPTKEEAKQVATGLNTDTVHAYYTRIQEDKVIYWDVRTTN